MRAWTFGAGRLGKRTAATRAGIARRQAPATRPGRLGGHAPFAVDHETGALPGENRPHVLPAFRPVIALLADIHANLEALEACLAHARAAGARRFVLLGDLVGYGADPAAVIDIAASLAAGGAVVIKGNHDEAVERTPTYLNDMAQAAIRWTRGTLSPGQKAFLAALPFVIREGSRCYVHGSADRPERWTYIDGPSAAARSMQAASCAHTFCGHVHDQRLFFESAPGQVSDFRPHAGTAIPIPTHRRWLAIAGSVGQPRDGDASAAYALLDESRITFHRVAYDYRAAAEKVRAAGLPAVLAYRIEHGV